MSDVAVALMAAGVTLVASFGGLLVRDILARRRPRDVFGYVEPGSSYDELKAIGDTLDTDRQFIAAMKRRRASVLPVKTFHIPLPPLRCTCAARLGECECAVDGVRNPRGAGRGRMQTRIAPPLTCPGSCRDFTECSTPAVCRAVMRDNQSFQRRNSGGSHA
jgi:hypothetical protein